MLFHMNRIQNRKAVEWIPENSADREQHELRGDIRERGCTHGKARQDVHDKGNQHNQADATA